jgi:RimJ/RimL family protein N-acetyltransferase
VDDTVETERLVLRPFTPADIDALSALHAIPEFWWFPLRRAMTAAESRGFLDRRIANRAEHGLDLWAADLRETGALVGWSGLSVPTFLPEVLPAVEVGWRFHPRVWGRGLATEAGAASIEFGFATVGLAEILSIYEPTNVASGAVMTRLGLRTRFDTVHPERDVPIRVRAITRDEWVTLPTSR